VAVPILPDLEIKDRRQLIHNWINTLFDTLVLFHNELVRVLKKINIVIKYSRETSMVLDSVYYW